MWIGHVLDGEFRLVAGGRDLNGADAEDAVDEALRDMTDRTCLRFTERRSLLRMPFSYMSSCSVTISVVAWVLMYQ